MNKKALVTLIIGVVVIIIIILLLLRSCTPRTKDETDNDGDGISDTTIDEQYRNGFINANIFFTCEILKDETLAKDSKRIEDGVHAAYQEYGLPVDDDATMVKILEKYKDDAEVTAIIKANASPCRGGQEPIFVQ